MLDAINSRYPGLNIRTACQRWLGRNPSDLLGLAAAIDMDVRDLQSWLRDDQRRYRVAANYEYLEALAKDNKKNRKKPGPKKKVDYHRIDRIRTIGANEYTDELLAERKRSLAASAETPALT